MTPWFSVYLGVLRIRTLIALLATS
jgi:hypothetical protein